MAKSSLGIRYANKFIQESKKLGYRIKGPVFKAGFNGNSWNVEFWIRSVGVNLPGRIGKARKEDFDEAVLAAISAAKKCEEVNRGIL